jgi:hypothetical protein
LCVDHIALQQRTTCESRLDILDLVVVGVLLGTEFFVFVPIPFRCIVATILSPVDIQAVTLGLIVGVGETSFPSFSQPFFHDALEHLHFSSDFLYLSPEEVNLTDLLSKCILVRFSERAKLIQKCFM